MEVLLAGNTGYVTETFIEESFPECDVVVLGNEMLKSNRKKNILSRPFIKDEKELKEIFETYEFERIVYFSNYLTMHGRMTGELEQLRQILQLCKKNKEIRMLYLTGQESIYNITSGKTLLVSAAENVVMEYGNMYQIKRQKKAEKLFLRNHRNKIFIFYVWMIWQNCFIKYMTIGEKNAV